jgi:hypothetical protein
MWAHCPEQGVQPVRTGMLFASGLFVRACRCASIQTRPDQSGVGRMRNLLYRSHVSKLERSKLTGNPDGQAVLFTQDMRDHLRRCKTLRTFARFML